MKYLELILCTLAVGVLTALGVCRFYGSLNNRARKYQLDYLRHFNLLDNSEFYRFLNSKQKTYLARFNFYTRKQTSAGSSTNSSSSSCSDSSATILSLDESTQLELNRILNMRTWINNNKKNKEINKIKIMFAFYFIFFVS